MIVRGGGGGISPEEEDDLMLQLRCCNEAFGNGSPFSTATRTGEDGRKRKLPVPDDKLRELCRRVEYRSYGRDEFVCWKDQPAVPALYLVLSGQCYVERSPRTVDVVPSSCSFGEDLLLKGFQNPREVAAPYSVWAKACSSSRGAAARRYYSALASSANSVASGMTTTTGALSSEGEEPPVCHCAVLTFEVCREVLLNDAANDNKKKGKRMYTLKAFRSKDDGDNGSTAQNGDKSPNKKDTKKNKKEQAVVVANQVANEVTSYFDEAATLDHVQASKLSYHSRNDKEEKRKKKEAEKREKKEAKKREKEEAKRRMKEEKKAAKAAAKKKEKEAKREAKKEKKKEKKGSGHFTLDDRCHGEDDSDELVSIASVFDAISPPETESETDDSDSAAAGSAAPAQEKRERRFGGLKVSASILAAGQTFVNFVSKGRSKDKGRLGQAIPRPPRNVYQEKLLKREGTFQRPVHPKSQDERDLIESAMEERAVLRHLPVGESAGHLAAAFERSRVTAGKEIVRQGSVDPYYYVVSKGECEYEVDGVRRPDLTHGVGESFGEEALIRNVPRTATVRAKTDTELFRLDRETYRRLVEMDVVESRKRKMGLLRSVSFLEKLKPDEMERLIDILEEKRFQPGDIICQKDESNRKFLLVEQGEVECRDVSSSSPKSGSAPGQDFKLRAGEHFGHQALKDDADVNAEPAVSADIVGSTPGRLYQVDKGVFRTVIGTSSDLDPWNLATVPALQHPSGRSLSASELMKIYHRIRKRTYLRGDSIVKAGVEAEAAIYFLWEGAAYTNDKHGSPGVAFRGRTVYQLTAGTRYGDEMFLRARKAGNHTGTPQFYLTARSDCIVDVLTVRDYLDAMREALAEAPSSLPDPHRASGASRPNSGIALSDLERQYCLGEGNFSQVWFVADKRGKKKTLTKPSVLKIQSKHFLIKEGQVEGCIQEKQILRKLRHPFIVDLMETYQDESFIYMLMEFVPGGELFSLMNPWERVAIPEGQAKFYALALADALAHMHKRKFIFRDLKPENVLIDRQGYPKLIDFGFAKHIGDSKTFTYCGTPGYLAPEILTFSGHGASADHWQLGVLIYEMLSNKGPYYETGISEMELHRSVVEDPVPHMEQPVTSDAWEIIQQLLVKNPAQRLGSLSRGEYDILHHPWFHGLSLADLRNKSIEAPWIPELMDERDTSCFEDWSDVEDITTTNTPSLSEEQAKMFADL